MDLPALPMMHYNIQSGVGGFNDVFQFSQIIESLFVKYLINQSHVTFGPS